MNLNENRPVGYLTYIKNFRLMVIMLVVLFSLVAAYQKNGISGVATVMTSLVITPTQPQLNIGGELLNVDFSTPTTLNTTGDCGNAVK